MIVCPDMSLTGLLAEICLRRVSPAARARAALHVLDWVGCATIGSVSEAGRVLAAWAAAQPAGGCRTLRAGRCDLGTAVIVNGGVGNVLEMDDIHRAAILHPGPVAVPAALALAEREGASAGALLDAIVRGYEAMIRVGAAVGPGHYRYWHNTATCGPFGAAAAGASLLGLDVAGWQNAFGSAGTQSAGLWQVRHEPVMSKQLHNGRAAHAGMLAADLARLGFTGPASILEGSQGFFAAMCPGADARDVVRDPDGPWKIHETSFKPWPACRHAHAAIDAALALRARIARAAVKRIAVRTYGDALVFCDRPAPRTVTEAKFSLQHCVAVALADGPPPLAAFEGAAIERCDLAALRARVEVVAAEPYASAYPGHYGAEVEVETEAGERHVAAVPDALGDPENPLDEPRIRAKAMALMRAADLPEARCAGIVAACLALPSGGAVAALTDLFP
jgi:2-methylcitrate dehydratase PrpD